MGTKLVAVGTCKQQERLLIACDFPMSYMPVAVYLWDARKESTFDQRLSRLFNTPVELRVMSQRGYMKKFNALARAEAEERQFRVFDECVDELRVVFCEIFSDLRNTGRFELLDGTPKDFRSQLVRLGR